MPLLCTRYRLKRGPWEAVDPLKVDLISVEELLVDGVVVPLRRSPDIGRRAVGVLLIG